MVGSTVWTYTEDLQTGLASRHSSELTHELAAHRRPFVLCGEPYTLLLSFVALTWLVRVASWKDIELTRLCHPHQQ